MHREEFSDLYCLATFIAGKIKEDDFDGTCGSHVVRREYPCKFRLGNLKERDRLEDVSINGRLIKMDLR